MLKNARYFYNLNGTIYSVSDISDELVKESIQDKDIKHYNYFELCKGYEMTHESALQYKKDFNQWVKEIEPVVNYKKYFTHNTAVRTFFQSKSKRQVDALELESITHKEFAFYEKCQNSGSMTFDEDYKEEEIEAFGYDFSAFYPNMLLKLNIATKQGKRKRLKTIDFENLNYGIYHVKITTDDKRFKKIFMFAKDEHYPHYSVKFAYKYKDEFNIKFELIQDGNYNALIYDNEKIAKGKDVFGVWFKSLQELKTKYPKNKLVKRLMSSLWGSLTAFNVEYFEDDEIDDLDISELDDPDQTEYKIVKEKYYNDKTKPCGYRTLYYCINSNKPYCSKIKTFSGFILPCICW